MEVEFRNHEIANVIFEWFLGLDVADDFALNVLLPAGFANPVSTPTTFDEEASRYQVIIGILVGKQICKRRNQNAVVRKLIEKDHFIFVTGLRIITSLRSRRTLPKSIHHVLRGFLMYQTDMHSPSSICFVDILTKRTDIVYRYVFRVDMIDTVDLLLAFLST